MNYKIGRLNNKYFADFGIMPALPALILEMWGHMLISLHSSILSDYFFIQLAMQETLSD